MSVIGNLATIFPDEERCCTFWLLVIWWRGCHVIGLNTWKALSHFMQEAFGLGVFNRSVWFFSLRCLCVCFHNLHCSTDLGVNKIDTEGAEFPTLPHHCHHRTIEELTDEPQMRVLQLLLFGLRKKTSVCLVRIWSHTCKWDHFPAKTKQFVTLHVQLQL